jgi:ribosomal protein S26
MRQSRRTIIPKRHTINRTTILNMIEHRTFNDPRITPADAAMIHAAAVTRDYSVQPRMGTRFLLSLL